MAECNCGNARGHVAHDPRCPAAPPPDEDELAHEEPRTHGIEGACYSGGPGVPYYQPVMMCTCGWQTERSDSWEDAGREFDVHLEEQR